MLVSSNMCRNAPSRLWCKVEHLRGGHTIRMKPLWMALVPLWKSPQSVPAPLTNEDMETRYAFKPGSDSSGSKAVGTNLLGSLYKHQESPEWQTSRRPCMG